MSCSLLRSSHISLAYFSPSFEEPTKTCRFIKCTSFCRAIIGEPSRVHRPIALLERSAGKVHKKGHDPTIYFQSGVRADGRHDILLSIVTTKAESFHRIADSIRSEEHTSELQSPCNLV